MVRDREVDRSLGPRRIPPKKKEEAEEFCSMVTSTWSRCHSGLLAVGTMRTCSKSGAVRGCQLNLWVLMEGVKINQSI